MRTEPKTLALLAVAALLICAGALLHRTPLDVAAFRWVNGWGSALAWPASALSVLGLGASAFVVAGVLGVRKPVLVGAMLLALIGGGLVVHAFKAWLSSPRPLPVLGADVVTVIGMALRANSMPSGHATLAAGAAALAAAAPAAYFPTRRRKLMTGLLAVFAVTVALARMLVGAHWTSDVVVGTGFGMAIGAAVTGTPWGRRACEWLAGWIARPWISRLLALVLVAVAWSLWKGRGDYPLAWMVNGFVAVLGAGAAAAWWRRSLRDTPAA